MPAAKLGWEEEKGFLCWQQLAVEGVCGDTQGQQLGSLCSLEGKGPSGLEKLCYEQPPAAAMEYLSSLTPEHCLGSSPWGQSPPIALSRRGWSLHQG